MKTFKLFIFRSAAVSGLARLTGKLTGESTKGKREHLEGFRTTQENNPSEKEQLKRTTLFARQLFTFLLGGA